MPRQSEGRELLATATLFLGGGCSRERLERRRHATSRNVLLAARVGRLDLTRSGGGARWIGVGARSFLAPAAAWLLRSLLRHGARRAPAAVRARRRALRGVADDRYP